METALLGLAGVLLLLTVVEIVLRRRYGLGTPPLYVADARMGYRLAPNQTLQRRGNRIEINQYSMRGGAIQPQRPPETLRILLLGDSVINGGWWTDQSQILSQGVRDALASHPACPAQVEVLNASANSWGPRNELGYVMRFGTFGSQRVVMVLNTDDLFAVAPNSLLVGRSPTYPTRRPRLALTEAASRIRYRRAVLKMQALHDLPGDRVGANLEAIRQLQHRIGSAGSRLLLAMTPLKRELAGGEVREYEQIARQRLRQLTETLALPYFDFLPLFAQKPYEALYRDHIHLSPAGNELVGKALAEFIATHLHEPSKGADPQPDDALQDPW